VLQSVLTSLVLVEENIYSARCRSLVAVYLEFNLSCHQNLNKKATVNFTMNNFYKKLHGWSSLVSQWV